MQEGHNKMKDKIYDYIISRKGGENLTLELVREILSEQESRTMFNLNKAQLKEIWYKENGWNKESFGEIEWVLINIKPPSNAKKRIPYYLTEEDVRLLIENATGKTKRIIKFISETGMRATEVANINFKDIDILQSKIIINYKAGKTDMECKREITKDLFYDIVNTFDGKKYLFETSTGKQYQRTEFAMLVSHAGKKTLNKKIGPHSLRHFWSTQQHKNGVSPHEVSRMMGHKNVGSRYNYYVHI